MEEKKLHMDEVNTRRVLADLLRNFWVAVLLAAAVWLGMSAYGKLNYHPLYTSETTIVVSAKGGNGAYSSLSLTTNMAKVFSEVFRSNILRERVEEKMGGEKLDGYIDTRIIPNTNLMIISVISSNPEQSFQALNQVIEVYPELTQAMFSNAVLEVITQPNVPTVPSQGTAVIRGRTKLAGVTLIAGLLLVCVLSVMRPTVQTPAAAKRRLDGTLLRSIRHEVQHRSLRKVRKRRNIAPLITSHFASLAFREDLQGLAAKLTYHMRKAEQKVLLISSAGENEGKSTVAANLALTLTEQDKRVALLDCDFRKPAIYKIFELKVDSEQSLAACISRGKGDFLTVKQGVYLGLSSGTVKNPQRLIALPAMKQIITQLRQEFDYVILDSPPMLVAADVQALAPLADTAVLVAREDFARVRDINDCLDTLRRSCGDVAGVVLNNCVEPLHFGK